MSDVITQAHYARSQLAQALDVLQVENVPPSIQDVAEPVARAMSWLHRIETKGEKIEAANEALSALRTALNQLQEPADAHPAADAALEVVATALGLVHQLTQTLNDKKRHGVSAPTPVAPTPAAPTPVAALGTPVAPPIPTTNADDDGARPVNPADAITVETHVKQEPPTDPVEADTRPEMVAVAGDDPIPLSRLSSPPTLASAPSAAVQQAVNQEATTQHAVAENRANQTAPQQPAQQQPAQQPSTPPGPRPSNPPSVLPPLNALPGELFVEAALGAYSTSNFYKSLNGNDVIDAGGLFIATYAPPEVEQAVRVHVSLPGGFEFQARGTVTWVREMPKTGSLNPLSPPGYGVRFTEISPEARLLVYRYVRNREPLFHDDF